MPEYDETVLRDGGRGKYLKRTIEVDMYPEALDRRLRDVAQIYKLGKSIEKARPLGKVRDAPAKDETA